MTVISDDGPRKRPDALVYAEARLSEWARWGREQRHELGYPTISTLYKAMKQKVTPVAQRIKRDVGPDLTARGSETIVFVEPRVGEVPNSVEQVETAVNRLPGDLRLVLVTNYFTYGPIEVKAKKTPWRRARYSQLLESAKYAIWVALDSRTTPL